VIVDLVEAGVKKSFELNLGYGTKAVNSHPKSRSNDPRFCQRGIHNSIWTKPFLEPIRDSKDSSFLPNILAENNYTAISFHLLSKSEIDRFHHIQFRHG
jgi:hypothetical protein